MFKKNILLVDEEWNLIHEYKSQFKPSVDEFIYLEPKYYKVLAVIHVIRLLCNTRNITVVVKEHANIYK